MVPMSPPARSDRLIGLIPRLDRHVGDKALLLPARKIFAHHRLDFALASEIIVGYGREERLLAVGSMLSFVIHWMQ